jgi:uncharacterized protein (TIGR00369 family)
MDLPNLNPEYIRELIALTNASPYPDHIAMKVVELDLDRAVIELQTAPCHLQPFGVVHGGVLATLIDTATFWAAFMRIPEECGMVNVDLKLNYLKAVDSGVLIAQGTTIHAGKSISYAEATIYNSSRQRIAHGTSTLMTLKGKGLKLGSRKFLD